jgi:DNA gyrase subunit B
VHFGYKTAQGITVLEGLEAVRHRPAMYIGADEPGRSLRTRLLEWVVDGVAHDTPPPEEVRVFLWRDGAMTVAYDGEPIPIEPFGRPVDGVAHPVFYQFFLYLFARGDPFQRTLSFGAVLNALSDRLVVSTVHGGERYRAVFSQGLIVSLLARTSCEAPLGITWLTFLPDATLITGEPLAREEAASVAERVTQAAGSVTVSVDDRTSEEADWY